VHFNRLSYVTAPTKHDQISSETISLISQFLRNTIKHSVQSNRLTSLDGIAACVALEELYVVGNATVFLTFILGVLWCFALFFVLLSNRLTSLDGIAACVALVDLYVVGNATVFVTFFRLFIRVFLCCYQTVLSLSMASPPVSR
jgi:VIT1/CCC1 family predicted Fe2+/Mn2+ transporter